MVHDYHESVGLNSYERYYFKKHFKCNLDRLRKFRKVISKEQSSESYRIDGVIGVYRTFVTKGKKLCNILLTRKKVDAYISEVLNLNKLNGNKCK